MSFWSLRTQVLARAPMVLSQRSRLRVNTVSFSSQNLRSSWETNKSHTHCPEFCLGQEVLNLSSLFSPCNCSTKKMLHRIPLHKTGKSETNLADVWPGTFLLLLSGPWGTCLELSPRIAWKSQTAYFSVDFRRAMSLLEKGQCVFLSRIGCSQPFSWFPSWLGCLGANRDGWGGVRWVLGRGKKCLFTSLVFANLLWKRWDKEIRIF